MKLNLGCGSNHLDGYCNVDIIETDAVDVVDDIVTLDQFASGTVEKILSEHSLEHLSFNEAELALNRWFELLVPAGELIVETPDMWQTCLEFCKYSGSLDSMPEEEIVKYPTLEKLKKINNWGIYTNWGRMRNIFGAQDNPGQFHRSGWWRWRLYEVCREIGYIAISVRKSVECTDLSGFSYHVREEPCLRMNAYKPRG